MSRAIDIARQICIQIVGSFCKLKLAKGHHDDCVLMMPKMRITKESNQTSSPLKSSFKAVFTFLPALKFYDKVHLDKSSCKVHFWSVLFYFVAQFLSILLIDFYSIGLCKSKVFLESILFVFALLRQPISKCINCKISKRYFSLVELTVNRILPLCCVFVYFAWKMG